MNRVHLIGCVGALALGAGGTIAQDPAKPGEHVGIGGGSLTGDEVVGARGAEAPVTGVDLLAMDTFVLGDDAIAIVNTSPPSYTALTGDISQLGIIAEIEYGQDGFIYALDTGDNTLLHRLNGTSGAFVKTFHITFPSGYNVLTAADWVNGALVVCLATEGGSGTAAIARIGLDEGSSTVSFDVGPIGLGVSGAVGGLTYDDGAGVFYAVTSAGSAPRLLTINGFGGVDANVALTENGVAAPGMTALEFGSDGQLYALPNVNSGRVGELFIVNRFSAQCLSLGSTGNTGLVSLTSRAACSSADLAPPFGQLDFSDVISFLVTFGNGCP
ncbi:MAG: hypothetical protein R3B57_14265 [Phycisphaerales bacterium]